MRDPLTPTAEELEVWSRDPNAMEPMEDWGLIISIDPRLTDTIFALAADPQNPQRFFFLGCLYMYIGDPWASKYRFHDMLTVDRLFSQVHSGSPAYLIRWRDRARALIESKGEGFDYEAWCGFGFSYRERQGAL